MTGGLRGRRLIPVSKKVISAKDNKMLCKKGAAPTKST